MRMTSVSTLHGWGKRGKKTGKNVEADFPYEEGATII